MQLYFIRHAQSENNAHWGKTEFQERSDPELTETGKAQAVLLAQFLGERQTGVDITLWDPQNRNGFGITHLYSSLMVRAVATADPVSQHIALPLTAWPEVHETGGIYSRVLEDEVAGLPGKNRSYFVSHYPGLILPDGLDESGWWNRPYEAVEECAPRAARVWQELLAKHGDRPGQPEHRVALISHGGFFMYLLTAALAVPLRRIEGSKHAYWFTMNNCGITRLDVTDQVVIQYTNRSDFLPDDLIT